MVIPAADVRTAFGKVYKGVNDAYFYQLLNEVDVQIVRYFGLRKKTIYLSVTEGSGLIDLDSDALWIESGRWIDAPASTPSHKGGFLLGESNVDEQDTDETDWRAASPGTPSKFMQTHNEVMGQVQLDRPTYYGTLIVSAATNASPGNPIVVTTSAAHGLSDGQRVDFYNAIGNTALNGNYYAKVTSYSSTTFGVYEDEDLTTPVSGNGVYTANSAILSCTNSPVLELFTRWHEELDSSSDMPNTPTYPSLYLYGTCSLYAARHVTADIGKYAGLYDDILAKQIELTQKRGGRKPPHIRLVTQRPNGYVSRY